MQLQLLTLAIIAYIAYTLVHCEMNMSFSFYLVFSFLLCDYIVIVYSAPIQPSF